MVSTEPHWSFCWLGLGVQGVAKHLSKAKSLSEMKALTQDPGLTEQPVKQLRLTTYHRPAVETSLPA